LGYEGYYQLAVSCLVWLLIQYAVDVLICLW